MEEEKQREYKIAEEFFNLNMTQKLIYTLVSKNGSTGEGNRAYTINDAFGLGLFNYGLQLLNSYFPGDFKKIKKEITKEVINSNTLDVLIESTKQDNSESKLSRFYYN